jgi:hypothetical protein
MTRWGAVVLLVCGGCSATTKSNAQQSVGTTGGDVTTSDGSGVAIPSGALPNTVTVTATPATGAPTPMAATVVGTPYTFGPEGQQFSSPVTVTLAFDPSKLPAGKTASDLVIFTAPAGSSNYVVLATTVADATHVSAKVSHFSTFVPGISGACTVACGMSGGAVSCSGSPNGGTTCTGNTPVGCSCTATCNSDGSAVGSCSANGTGGAPSGGNGSGAGGPPSDGGMTGAPSGCAGAIAYVISCDQNGSCTCTNNGMTTKTTMNACGDLPTLFNAYATGCGYPGIYAAPSLSAPSSSTTSADAGSGTSGNGSPPGTGCASQTDCPSGTTCGTDHLCH